MYTWLSHATLAITFPKLEHSNSFQPERTRLLHYQQNGEYPVCAHVSTQRDNSCIAKQARPPGNATTTPLLRRDAKNSPKRAEFFCCDFQSFTPPTAQIHCDPSQNWIICPRSEKLYYESGRKISTLRRNVRSIDHPNQSLNWLQRFLIRWRIVFSRYSF